MASTYTDLLRIEKQADGENDSTWGSKTNTNFEMFEDAIAGRAAITHSDAASYTLTTANAATDEARNMILNIGGALTAARNTVVPTASKLYVAKNATTGGFATTLKTAAGTGISIPNGLTTALFCDGTNVVDAINYVSTLTVGGVVLAGNGAVGGPGYSFTADPTAGLYRSGSGDIRFSVAGSDVTRWNTGGLSLHASSGLFWGSVGVATADLSLFRDAANVLAQRNSTTAQGFRVYNTFTDASNYERGSFNWAGNILRIATEKAGTGSARSIVFQVQGVDTWTISSAGHFINTDNAFDIGASSATRPRSLYWGTQALGPDGTVAAPAFAFASATGSGIYKTSATRLGWSLGGVYGGALASGGIILKSTASLIWGADDTENPAFDLLLVRDAANTFSQRNSTTAQTFRVYNTFTDAANYERGVIEWSGNVLTIGQQWAGTGTTRSVQLRSGGILNINIGTTNVWQWSTSGHLLAVTDNSFDIGAAGATRPRDAFFSHAVSVGILDSGAASTLALRTNAGTGQVDILHTASATRTVTLTGSNGGNPTISTSAGSLAITPAVVMASTLTFSTAASKIIPGATSMSLRNTADNADNVLISDAGNVTVRGAITVTSDIVIGGASMVQNSKSTAYTTVAADANKHLLHPTADNNARTFTIDSNANVAYTIGTCITFVNQINTVTIAITSDTLTLAGAGTTGSRTLAANGVATAIKIEATKWVISGTGLT